MSDIQNDTYVSDDANVVKDSAPIETSKQDNDSDAQVAADEKEAMNEDNIVDGRTRGVKADYVEKEETDLPKEIVDGDDGTSAAAQ